MGVVMHAKSDSEVTTTMSAEASTPPRSPRRPLYYVQSPSQSQQMNMIDMENMSYYGSTPAGSPQHHYHYHYHCSPIHHSRESSTSRFSASLKNPLDVLHRNANSDAAAAAAAAANGWKRLQKSRNEDDDQDGEEDDDDDDDDDDEKSLVMGAEAAELKRFYAVCLVLSFVALFSIFSLILWAASIPYRPKIFVKNIVLHNLKVQAGMDESGVATDMLNLKSTVKIFYRNPATFFGVHVTATPLHFRYLDLNLASGHMNKFYQSRKSQRVVVVVVQGHQVPLYGGIPLTLSKGSRGHTETSSTSMSVAVPLNLTFRMRSRAYILGRLVKPKFYTTVLCQLTLSTNHIGNPINLTRHTSSCLYY